MDATIIGAPSSTKNKDGKRDPEMHQTAKGKQWYFGMKAHVGVDSKTKLIHTILASAANVADGERCRTCCMERRRASGATKAYRGPERDAIRARGAASARTSRTSKLSMAAAGSTRTIKAKNRNKSKVRAKVEHTIGVIKRVFGFQKVRYRGLAKNLHRLEVTAALANLYTVRRRLLNA